MIVRAIAIALLLAFAQVASVRAYVLPSSPVLGGWLEKIRTTQTLHVVQRTTIYDPKFPEGAASIDEEIWIRRPFDYRRSSDYPNGKLDLVVGRDRAVRSFAGKVDLLPLSEALGPLGALYLYSEKGRMNGFLRQSGVDPAQTRWVLRDRQVGIEVGDPSGPRLIFSKQEFFPMGAEMTGKSYRFEMALAGRFPIPYPSVIEVRSGGNLLERTEVRAVEADPRVDERRFEIPRAQPSTGNP
jgi:hypothetical protein